MLTILFIVLSSLFKAVADTVKPDQFETSCWSYFSGNKWWDTRISFKNQHKWSMWIYWFLVHFSDPWHLANSLTYSCFFIAAFVFERDLNLIYIFILYWFIFGWCFECFRNLFKSWKK